MFHVRHRECHHSRLPGIPQGDLDSNPDQNIAFRDETYTFQFDPERQTADIERTGLRDNGEKVDEVWTSSTVATPSTMIFSFRTSRSENVFVDHRFKIDRASLAMEGSDVMPGWMNERVEGQCTKTKANTSHNQF